MRVITVIPAHNEEKTIQEVIRGVKKYVSDVIVIDDGSTDNTARIAKEAGAAVITHVINRGVGAALRTGYNVAFMEGFDYIIQIDSDMQHNPEFIPVLLETIQDGNHDVVIGSRFLNVSHKDYNLIRRVGITFFTSLVNLLGSTNITDVTSGYRVYRVKSLKKIGKSPDKHWAVEQTFEFARRGMKIKEISIEMPPRKKGKSQFNLKTFIMYPARMIETILRVLLFRR
ncbi:MAG: glycosyltransferase family 2 protein [Candidatus Hydrothermarchaeaceae archaeon]